MFKIRIPWPKFVLKLQFWCGSILLISSCHAGTSLQHLIFLLLTYWQTGIISFTICLTNHISTVLSFFIEFLFLKNLKKAMVRLTVHTSACVHVAWSVTLLKLASISMYHDDVGSWSIVHCGAIFSEICPLFFWNCVQY